MKYKYTCTQAYICMWVCICVPLHYVQHTRAVNGIEPLVTPLEFLFCLFVIIFAHHSAAAAAFAGICYILFSSPLGDFLPNSWRAQSALRGGCKRPRCRQWMKMRPLSVATSVRPGFGGWAKGLWFVCLFLRLFTRRVVFNYTCVYVGVCVDSVSCCFWLWVEAHFKLTGKQAQPQLAEHPSIVTGGLTVMLLVGCTCIYVNKWRQINCVLAYTYAYSFIKICAYVCMYVMIQVRAFECCCTSARLHKHTCTYVCKQRVTVLLLIDWMASTSGLHALSCEQVFVCFQCSKNRCWSL